jgi:hypothetical protein
VRVAGAGLVVRLLGRGRLGWAVRGRGILALAAAIVLFEDALELHAYAACTCLGVIGVIGSWMATDLVATTLVAGLAPALDDTQLWLEVASGRRIWLGDGRGRCRVDRHVAVVVHGGGVVEIEQTMGEVWMGWG